MSAATRLTLMRRTRVPVIWLLALALLAYGHSSVVVQLLGPAHRHDGAVQAAAPGWLDSANTLMAGIRAWRADLRQHGLPGQHGHGHGHGDGGRVEAAHELAQELASARRLAHALAHGHEAAHDHAHEHVHEPDHEHDHDHDHAPAHAHEHAAEEVPAQPPAQRALQVQRQAGPMADHDHAGHSHTGYQRHHHAAQDTSVVALDGAAGAQAADAASAAAAGGASLPLALAPHWAPMLMSDPRQAWLDRAAPRWVDAALAPPEQPPRA